MPAPPGGRLAFTPTTARIRVATRAAVCAAAPVAIGAATGHTATGLIASSGSLAALYSADGPPRHEALTVGAAAVTLPLSLAVGSVAAGQAWAAVVLTAVWTALVSYVCTALNARPPGMMMFVLVCTLGTVLPETPATAVAATAITAATATLVTVADQAWRSRRTSSPSGGCARRGLRAEIRPKPPKARFAARTRWSLNPAGSPLPFMAARTAGAVAAAGSAAVLADLERPYWAMATTAAVLGRGNQAATATGRAAQRLAGTLIGCLLAAGVLLVHPRPWAVALALAALTFATELFVGRNYALAMVFVTLMALLVSDAAEPGRPVSSLLGSRAGEALLGCTAALVASHAVTRRWALRHHHNALAAVERSSAALAAPSPSREAERQQGRLEAAVQRLELVSHRTHAERRSVRTATDELHDPTKQALQRAAALLIPPAAGSASTGEPGSTSLTGRLHSPERRP